MAKASLQPLPPLVKDLTDQTFGRLTVLRFVGIEKHKAVIDRKDNSLGYTCGHCDECHDRGWPANCRWATATEQAENRGPSKPVSADGVTLSVPAWAKKLGVSKQAIYSRLRHGWPPAEAVTVPFSTANTWRYRKVKRLGDG